MLRLPVGSAAAYGFGRPLATPDDGHRRRGPFFLDGLAVSSLTPSARRSGFPGGEVAQGQAERARLLGERKALRSSGLTSTVTVRATLGLSRSSSAS